MRKQAVNIYIFANLDTSVCTFTCTYILACLSTMLLGYLFRSCFVIIVPKFGKLLSPLGFFAPNFWFFLPPTFGKCCPQLPQKLGTKIPKSSGQKIFPKYYCPPFFCPQLLIFFAPKFEEIVPPLGFFVPGNLCPQLLFFCPQFSQKLGTKKPKCWWQKIPKGTQFPQTWGQTLLNVGDKNSPKGTQHPQIWGKANCPNLGIKITKHGDNNDPNLDKIVLKKTLQSAMLTYICSVRLLMKDWSRVVHYASLHGYCRASVYAFLVFYSQ